MKTSLEVESLLVNPRPLSPAANDEFVLTKPAAGWDPFEVWRTRVKPVQDNAQNGAAIG